MVSDEEDEQVKETFAYFGRAAYMANVLEQALMNVLMFLEFIKQKKIQFNGKKASEIDYEKYNSEFDDFMTHKFKLTMGELGKKIKELSVFDDELNRRIYEATKKRNFLLHNFWREESDSMLSEEGRIKLIEDLDEYSYIFKQLDSDIEDALAPILNKLSIDIKFLNLYTEEYIDKIKAGGSVYL